MPSALDELITAGLEQVIGEGKMFQMGHFEKYGQSLPIIANAPPSLPFYFAAFCHQHAETTFIVDGEERLTFGQIYAQADAFARALVDGWGVQKGDRIGIAMRNAPSWIVAYMGALMAGGVATLLNGWWQGGELADGIADAGCTLVLVDEPR
ncbi:MAG: AMP-binding protein, partial [Sphingopyxis sp.]